MKKSTSISSVGQAESVGENPAPSAVSPPQQANNQSKSNKQRDSSTPALAIVKPDSDAKERSKNSKARNKTDEGNSDGEGESKPKKPEFEETANGIFAKVGSGDKVRKVFVCSAMKVLAVSSNEGGAGWGVLIGFEDRDGNKHYVYIPFSRLETEPGAVRAQLLNEGLRLGTTRESRDMFFLYLITAETNKRVKSVERVGWCGNDSFVFSNNHIGDQKLPIILQAPSEAEYRTNALGSIDDWRTHISIRCVGNSRLLLAVSCPFVSVLLRPLGENGGGFHVQGPSSTGKSTFLYVAGSALGGGGPDGFVRTWNSTRNALEPLAVAHNDMLLPLDEFGLLDARDAGEAAYILAEGQGKERASKTGTAMRRLSWLVFILSTGEIGLAAHVEAGGKKVRAGQAIRFIDIAADAQAGMGLFEDIHGAASPSEFAQQLKRDALRFYGTAIREFISKFIENREVHLVTLRNRIDAFLANHVPSNACGEVHRAARRFAIVAAAGELATDFGITGWTDGDATWGVGKCFASWLAERGTTESSDEDRAVRQVIGFIEAHGLSRFWDVDSDYVRVVANRVGYKKLDSRTGRYEYQFLPEAFRNDVCEGYDYKLVIRALAKRGMMEKQSGDHLTVRRRIEGRLCGVYAVTLPEIGGGK